MSSKPRILIIDNSTFVTGALRSIVALANDLKTDFEFCFLMPQNSRGRYLIEEEGFTNIFEMPMKEISKRPGSLFLYFPLLLANSIRLIKLVKKLNIDMIHNNDLYNLLPVVAKIFGLRVPYISHIRFLPDRFPKPLFSFWVRSHLAFSSRIISVSNYLLKKLPAHSKITCIWDQLPTEKGYPLVDKPSGYRLLYLSNFIRGKGQEHALMAFEKVHRKFPEWRIRFVGSDMGLSKNRVFKRELEQFCFDRNIASKVEWQTFSEHPESEFKAADVVLNFSESESFSRTCMEALFYGRPIVATDSGGPAEIIDHGITGYLVVKNDINAMAEAMEKLMSSPGLRENFGKEGMIRVRQKFSIKKTSYKMALLYREVLKT